MEIILNRFLSNKDETLGRISVNDEHFCFTLEDEYREEKVMHETRIPAGTYEILLRNAGGMNKRYQAKFKSKHHGMLWLQDVPGFEWVYLHIGNTEKHTSGCILVGYGCTTKPFQGYQVTNSTSCYLILSQLISEAITEGEMVTIKIIDGDR